MPTKKPRWTEYVRLDDLQPHPDNPKGHADADIDESFERFGFTEQVMVDERTGLLISGHGRRERLMAARERGDEPPEGVVITGGKWTVPVQRGWASKDDDEARAYLIAANQITMKGAWQQDPLIAILDELRHGTAGLLGIGFPESEVDRMLQEAGKLGDRHGGFLDELAGPLGHAPPKPMGAAEGLDHQPSELILLYSPEERDEAVTLLRGAQKALETTSLAQTVLAVMRAWQPPGD